MSLPQIFDKLKFDVFYKPVIALSGTILLFSLFIPTIQLSNLKIQTLSFIWFIYGIIAWFINNLGTLLTTAFREYGIEKSWQMRDKILLERKKRIRPVYLIIPAIIHTILQISLLIITFYFFFINF